jgi:L-amino acid N-acyltransferase YncA
MPDDQSHTAHDTAAERDAVVGHYAGLARTALAGGEPAGGGCSGAAAYGAEQDAPEGAVRASLGCGNPVAVAALSDGDVVLDLGSGGGLDVVLSARRVGPAGKAYGLDAGDDMLSLARANAEEAGVVNAEFLLGHSEGVPLPDGHVDVVISNCVINLSADKPRVLAEAFRVLKPGGRFCVADMIIDALPDVPAQTPVDDGARAAAGDRTGCGTGVLTAGEYRGLLLAAGFVHLDIALTEAAGDGLSSAIVRAAKPSAPIGATIRPMRPADAGQVLAVYQAGLDTGGASFETAAPSWDGFDASKLPLHRHVAIDTATGDLLGWVAAVPVSDRCVYAGVVEHSVYVDPRARGRGIGAALLQALIGSTEAAGVWTIQSGVFPENAVSLRLHERAGFRTVGTRVRVGRHHGRWRDVVLLERRSTVAGTD